MTTIKPFIDIHNLHEFIDQRRVTDEKVLYQEQPATWTCDQRTRDIWCLTRFINDRFSDLGERRRDLLLFFGRIVRSTADPFEAAIVVVNVGDNGLDIDEHARGYWTARRR